MDTWDLIVHNTDTTTRHGTGSDHQILNLQIYSNKDFGLNSRYNVNKINNRLYNQRKGMDWIEFRERLESRKNEEHKKRSNIKRSKGIRTRLQNRPNNKKPNHNKNKKSWWDEECKEAWESWKKSMNNVWKTGNMEDFIITEHNRKKWTELKQHKKEKAWTLLTEEIAKEKDIGKIWNKAKGIQNFFIKENSALNPRRRTELEEAEIIKLKNKNTTVAGITCENNSTGNIDMNSLYYIWEKDIENYEIIMTINNSRNKTSASGDERIDYRTMSELPSYLKEAYCEIVKESWKNTIIPNDWKIGRLCFIDKLIVAGNATIRPITLTSCPEKIMEKLINNRLTL
ncbi:uncharacterized protein LOC128896810 isoform X2 [Hylaeus anthracinus]|uniref:uncharacterized protein LOC128896810 isoform X2 n=1 Tax=Hylaeus anthracinus TaxID=313031 RepID=UPI0023B99BD0|nr:uncharacterized protein LOC128896810 isoform X2 [Hylaeus anthracinus]